MNSANGEYLVPDYLKEEILSEDKKYKIKQILMFLNFSNDEIVSDKFIGFIIKNINLNKDLTINIYFEEQIKKIIGRSGDLNLNGFPSSNMKKLEDIIKMKKGYLEDKKELRVQEAKKERRIEMIKRIGLSLAMSYCVCFIFEKMQKKNIDSQDSGYFDYRPIKLKNFRDIGPKNITANLIKYLNPEHFNNQNS